VDKRWIESRFAHGDDLEDGEEDGRRCHRGWELQHVRDVGGYLGRRDHPVKRIVARAVSDNPESHGGQGSKYMLKRRCPRLGLLHRHCTVMILAEECLTAKISGLSKFRVSVSS
jgi:hypothetical protein